MPSDIGRRTVLCGLACAALTGCAGYGSRRATAAAPAAPGGAPLAAVTDVPVGGGLILAAQDIVITQPVEGEFRAFSAACTHQGCQVTGVTDTIDCSCHGSSFALADGSVVAGPAPSPLPGRAITVADGVITAA